MSFLKSKQNGSVAGNITSGHINKIFPICPLCGCHNPAWTVHYRVDLLDGRIQFRCSSCDSALSITQTDMLGVNKLHGKGNLFTKIYTWPLTTSDSIKKNLKGQDSSTAYVRIDELGFLDEIPFQKGSEVPIEYLQQAARKFL